MRTMQEETEVAVVTGASRRGGIGFEVCRQLAAQGKRVVLTARDASAADALAKELHDGEGVPVRSAQLDIASADSIRAFASWMRDTFGRIDILVNNAAATAAMGERPSSAQLDHARAVMDTTLFGTWRLTSACIPLMRRGSRVVNVSSGAGSHGDTMFGLTTGNAMGPSYAIAKAALNALTASLATELASEGILVNAVCPGFTATFPGGEQMGARPVADGARSVVWAALLPPTGPSGGFFRDGARVSW